MERLFRTLNALVLLLHFIIVYYKECARFAHAALLGGSLLGLDTIFAYYSILVFPHFLPIILSKVPIILVHISYYSHFRLMITNKECIFV